MKYFLMDLGLVIFGYSVGYFAGYIGMNIWALFQIILAYSFAWFVVDYIVKEKL